MQSNRCLILVLTIIFFFPVTVFAGGQRDVSDDAVSDGIAAGGIEAEILFQEEAAAVSGKDADSINEGRVLTITEEGAVDYALEHNLQIKSSAIEMGMKKRAEDFAWNRFVPSVQASGTMGRMNEDQSTSVLAGFDEFRPSANVPGVGTVYQDVIEVSMDLPQWNLSAGLDFSLTLNLAMYNGIRSTQIDYQAGRISYEQARQKIKRDVRKSFYNLLLMQENRAVMVENIDAAERRYEQARINYENGMVPELTVLSAQVAWENLKPQLRALDLGYRQAVQGFKMALGMDLDQEIELEGSFDAETVDVDADELIDRYLMDRLDIQSLMVTIDSLKNQLQATKLQIYTPQFILGYNVDPAFGGDPLNDPWFGGDYEWNQRSGMFRLTVAMSLDSFLPFSQAQVGIRDLADSIRMSRIGLIQAVRGAEMEIDATVEQLKKSRDTLEALELNVNRARRAYEMAEEAYNAGSKELLEVENAELELKTAQVEVLKEKYNYLSALIDLEYQLNNDLDTLLDE